VLLADVVATSAVVASSSSRKAKIAALADLLRRLAPAEVAPVAAFLVGTPTQGRIGVGWASLAALDRPASRRPEPLRRDHQPRPEPQPQLTVGDLDRVLGEIQAIAGPGAVAARAALLGDLLGRSTEAEADFVRRLLVGELRQGALAGVMTDAVAQAAAVPVAAVRRALLLSGDLSEVARIALTEGAPGLAEVGLHVLRPLAPMLASPADSVAEALAGVDGPASVEWKLDGVRLQAHKAGDEVRLFTRNLNDVTHRLPDVVALVRALPAVEVVLDGEVIGLRDDGERPQAFQDVMSGFGRDDHTSRELPLRPYFFDCLHLDGDDLVDRPLAERQQALARAAAPLLVPGIVTTEPDEAAAFLDRALAAGHEGVVVKGLATRYDAGRRGRAWRKVKVARTVDLVVLGAEWGHGRRRGWLSNLHLGARDPADPGRYVMVGKTFKGLTDQLLQWQTEALLAREVERRGNTVHVRPELVVEIELDGVQASTRYPGGVALRFARVLRYRPDKDAAEADAIGTLRALLPG
jgi:DNA ligase-1